MRQVLEAITAGETLSRCLGRHLISRLIVQPQICGFARSVFRIGCPEQHVKFLSDRVQLFLSLSLVLGVRSVDLTDDGRKLIHGSRLQLLRPVHVRDLVLHVCELSLCLSLIRLGLVDNGTLNLSNLSFPLVLFATDHHLLHRDDILVLLELFLQVEHPDKISDERNPFASGSLGLHLRDAVEGVAHDGNQKVHEEELGHEGGQEEEHPDDGIVLGPKVLHVEFTEPD